MTIATSTVDGNGGGGGNAVGMEGCTERVLKGEGPRGFAF